MHHRRPKPAEPHLSEVHREAVGVPQHERVRARQLAALRGGRHLVELRARGGGRTHASREHLVTQAQVGTERGMRPWHVHRRGAARGSG